MTAPKRFLLMMMLGATAACAGGNQKTNNSNVNNLNNVTAEICDDTTDNDGDGDADCDDTDCSAAANCVLNNVNNTNNTTNNCTGACTTGYQQCVSNVVQTCVAGAPCPTWGNTENCSDTSRTCSADDVEHTAACTSPCTNECAAGESTCVSNEVHACGSSGGCMVFSLSQDCLLTGQICEFNQLASEATCVNSCVPTCSTEGVDQCDGTTIETCTLVNNCLQWVAGTDCSLTSQSCVLVGEAALCQTVGSLNVFFSEYVEGSSNNKGLEIYVMSAPGGFNLSSCSVEIYSNGSSAASATIALSSVALSGGSRFEICHSQWALAFTCDQLAGNLTFNGDDAVRLVCSGITMDVLGKIGEDPGLSWTGGAVSTVDSTLRRKCGTITGDTNGADSFDPSVEWTSAGIDDVSNLGTFLPCK